SQADVNTQALDGRDHTMLTPESEPILIDEDSPLDPITTPTPQLTLNADLSKNLCLVISIPLGLGLPHH
ncbi:hypothetical protein H0H93_004277, partial [Arthromyces matolae]